MGLTMTHADADEYDRASQICHELDEPTRYHKTDITQPVGGMVEFDLDEIRMGV
jgi:hypothetical protein